MMLSIVTVNKNNSQGLLNTLKSVKEQTFRAFEHIIIDGKSTDTSVSVIKNIEKEYPIPLKWISEEDGGIYQAMNKGIGMAEGRYILFLNSGDKLNDGNVLEKIFSKERNAEILYGDSIMYDGNNLPFYNKEPEEITLLRFIEKSICHQSVFYFIDLFSDERFGLYNERYRIASDWEFNVKTIILGNVSLEYFPFPVSKVESGGVSVIETELSLNERDQILKSLIQDRIVNDYELLVELRKKMKKIKSNLFFKVINKLQKLV
jgi:glycosyltransferase involved in cell wall biosynthesis